ncbi:MAG: DUF4421 family protein [Bacteroidales bacterium]|jgi:hypothetical protein|nr:DUF4421 family protein [Bacteroidales bacterium]
MTIFFVWIFNIYKSSAQDTNYVKKYGNILNVKVFTYNNVLEFKDKGSGLNYIPDLHSGIGVGFYCKYFPFDFTMRQEVSLIGNDKYHSTSVTDLQLKGYNKYFAGDIYIQNYTGFYTSDVISYKSKIKDLHESEYNPDMSVRLIEAVGKYIFNHEKFSYKAGFTSYEKQKISAGSATIGCALYYVSICADSSLVKLENHDNIQACNFGFNGGYSYNYVFGKRSTLFISGLLGLNSSNFIFKAKHDREMRISPALHIKAAYWQNFHNWSAGITCVYNLVHQTFDKDLTIFINSRRIEMMLIRRLWYPKKQNKSNITTKQY